jgi:hypothetical protein
MPKSSTIVTKAIAVGMACLSIGIALTASAMFAYVHYFNAAWKDAISLGMGSDNSPA